MRPTDRALGIALGALLLFAAKGTGEPSAPSGTPESLCVELFQEGNWAACRVECAREIEQSPTPANRLRHAICGLRLGFDTTGALQALCTDVTTPTDIRALAHYELGRAMWTSGDMTGAFANLKQAFLTAEDTELHRHAGCTLNFVIAEDPTLAAADPGLKPLLATCRAQWNRPLRNECRKPEAGQKGLSTAPARGLIAFYQTHIGPAIGDRCSLHPSCSRYAAEALRKHGLVGIGAIGDRFVREPSTVAAGEHPIVINGHGKYSDALADHDGWLK